MENHDAFAVVNIPRTTKSKNLFEEK